MGERWAKDNNQGGYQNPSFSSTLLDAIYRSIDESDGNAAAFGGGSARDRCCAPAGIIPNRLPTTLRPPAEAANKRGSSRCRTLPPISTSSSSDISSYGGFSSSSDPDSAATRLRPIRTGVAPLRSVARPPPLAEEDEKKKKKSGSIRGKLRDLGGSRSATPASPGARLAGFLGSLLSAVSGAPRKQSPSSSVAGAGGRDDSACSTASSHSRSCLTKKPSTREGAAKGGKRTVRFYPVSVIVDEDPRPCGKRSVCEPNPSSRRLSAAALEARRRVEELLRGMEEEEEEMSDSSSDLFELENFTATESGGGGSGGGRTDELPVYETTRLDSNRSFSQSQRFLKT
ncbi:protein BIG GRAIN 1-like [Zingiber officinale]|uniref:protein BIG GRAIN 1-like n=1 Tax=Zingiber officinale TaxID=94328 RepID=UPI001C4D0980|nr:protein BIG GRAIN 1-like [Zingiber officinale]